MSDSLFTVCRACQSDQSDPPYIHVGSVQTFYKVIVMTDNHFLPSAKSELSTGFVPEDNTFPSLVPMIIVGHVENLGTVYFFMFINICNVQKITCLLDFDFFTLFGVNMYNLYVNYVHVYTFYYFIFIMKYIPIPVS